MMSVAGAVWAMALVSGCQSERSIFDQIGIDTWTQSPNNQIDILWVIDNSTSMLGEQALLASGFEAFAEQLDGSAVDFHLGVITTAFENGDPAAGVLLGSPPILDGDTPYVSAFAARATTEVSTVVAANKEKGLAAAAYALSPSMALLGGPNEGFLRRDAQLLVVFVSDEEDCSDNGILDDQGPDACYELLDRLPSVGGFVTALWRAKGDRRDHVQIGAIVGTEGSICPEVYPGGRYIEAAELTGGLVGDICRNDFRGMLEQLGLSAIGIRSSFQLSDAAQPNTIEVRVDDETVPEDPVDGWTYDPVTWFLHFHGNAVPARGAQITAVYRLQAGAVAPGSTSATP